MPRSSLLDEKLKERPSKADKPGFIYVLERPRTKGKKKGLWKVGRTICLEKRVKQWNRQCRGHEYFLRRHRMVRYSHKYGKSSLVLCLSN
jgi:hypothetical protein